MDIDIERLKTDAAYWDEVAPEGATHHNGDLANPWLKESPASYFTEYADWVAYQSESNAIVHFAHATPRPTKPASREWNDAGDFPPVGERVDACVYGDWQELVVCGYGNRFCIGINEDGEDIVFEFNDSTFRPIHTAEQRQRDELVDFVATASGIRARDGRGAIALDIADAILSRYNLEPKDA